MDRVRQASLYKLYQRNIVNLRITC